MPDSIEALADLKRRVRVPLAFGERLYTRSQFRTLLEMRGADFVQPDVSHAGGITELRKIAAMAEASAIPFCPHNPSGPVANAATLHLAASTPNFYLLETMATDVPWRCEISTERVRMESGSMLVPTGPGLGIDIHEEAIARYPYRPTSLRHYRGKLVDIRPPDAKPYYR